MRFDYSCPIQPISESRAGYPEREKNGRTDGQTEEILKSNYKIKDNYDCFCKKKN